MFNVTLNSSWLKINWSQLKVFRSKLNCIERKKPRHFSYTIEYPYPPTNSVWFPHNERLSQLYCALFSSVFFVLNLTAWDHLGVGMKTLMGIKKRRISRWFRIRYKVSTKYTKKNVCKNVTEICTFHFHSCSSNLFWF